MCCVMDVQWEGGVNARRTIDRDWLIRGHGDQSEAALRPCAKVCRTKDASSLLQALEARLLAVSAGQRFVFSPRRLSLSVESKTVVGNVSTGTETFARAACARLLCSLNLCREDRRGNPRRTAPKELEPRGEPTTVCHLSLSSPIP